MSPPFARDIAALRVAGYYLPAVSFGYLFTQTRTDGYLWLTALALLAAVNLHGFLRALPDRDDVDRGPTMGTATPVQFALAALYGTDDPRAYPATLRRVLAARPLPSGPRAGFVAAFALFAATFVVLVPYSAYLLWTVLPLDVMHPTYHLIGQTLVFLTVTWTLQEAAWRLWPAVTVGRAAADREARSDLEELRAFLTGPAGPEGVTHITYESRGGGYVLIDYVTAATSRDGLRREVEDVSIGYLANVLNGRYPCEQVAVTILDEDRDPVGAFTLDTDWGDEYADGRITLREYVERAWENVDLYRPTRLALDEPDPDDVAPAGVTDPSATDDPTPASRRAFRN